MTTQRWKKIAWGATAAVGVCAGLALSHEIGFRLVANLDQSFWLTTGERVLFEVWYYLAWAALVPAIFGLATRVPFRRSRWLWPLAFHLIAGVAIAVSANLLVEILFGGLIRSDWPDLTPVMLRSWTRLAAYHAVRDTPMYWLILTAGFVVQAYDEDRDRRRQAADLEAALTAAQVDVLKMKLQPHFLFNTLNSISFLAVERDTEGVVAMVQRLSRLLRSSMQSDGSQLVTVEQELSLLDQYLAIEEVRFADRLRVARCIEPAARHALLPSLVLQPVIENSIKHGFSKRLDASRLEIGIKRDGESLLVTVTDDGPGLPAGWDLATGCGRGLRNVIERLEVLYRGAWSFSLEGGSAGGTVAALRIPLAFAPAHPRVATAR